MGHQKITALFDSEGILELMEVIPSLYFTDERRESKGGESYTQRLSTVTSRTPAV